MREPGRTKPKRARTEPESDAQSAELRSRLDALKADLGEAIAEDRKREGANGGQRATGGALGTGLRAGSELVAGVLVGGAIGYLLDRQIGTAPLFLIVFLMMGMGAGFWNIYRLGARSNARGNDRD
jgi:ATP synthase protein I